MPVDKNRLTKFRADVRDQVIKDATIHVRLTRPIMRKLLENADRSGVPYGVLVRQWVEEKLDDKPIDLANRLERIEKKLNKLGAKKQA